MDPNQPSTSRAAANNGKTTNRGGGNWRRPWFRGGWNRSNDQRPRQKPTTMPIPDDNYINLTSLPDNSASVQQQNAPMPASFMLTSETEQNFGWKLYFSTDFKDESVEHRKVKVFKRHFRENQLLYKFQEIKKCLWFQMHMTRLTGDHSFVTLWPTFQQDLIESPEENLNCAGLGMYQLISKLPDPDTPSQQTQQEIKQNTNLQMIRARIENPRQQVSLRSLNVSSYGRLISARGTVMRANAAKILCTWMAFKCSSCGSKQAIKQTDGDMTVPTSCGTACRAKSNFVPLLSSPYTRTEATQMIRLQESMEGPQFDAGRVPRNIEVCLQQDLVDSVCPGDDVTITGIPKVRPLEENHRKDQASLYKIYLQCVYIVCHKNFRANRKHDFTEKDLEAIRTIKDEPCPFRLLVHSLCPSIYGHELVKAGLILGLFGGSDSDETRRSASHVLVVGDPGIGKSQMLLACSNVSPRGLFVCGTSSSTAGLTVSVRHEKGHGATLEAGALVLADQGTCCIDEFDKMSSNHQALLEVMEQQTVSIAKAGVQCTLPARCCILAAANPSEGFYNKSKTIAENLKMNPALLTRFDLIFILVDRPDAERDRMLTAHIQALHKRIRMDTISGQSRSSYSSFHGNSEIDEDRLNDPLEQRLRLLPDEEINTLPHVLMQKYIAYAKKNIHPTLSPEACNILKAFYLELRQANLSGSSIPITIRQLEGMIRLTQARARVDLSREVTLRHAEDVLEIMKFSLGEVMCSNVDVPQMTQGNSTRMGQAAQIKKFHQIIQTKSTQLNKTVFSSDELKDMSKIGGFQQNLNQLLDVLNHQGVLLKKGLNLYKFIRD